MEQTFKPLIDWQKAVMPERSIPRLSAGFLEESQELTIDLINFDGTPQARDRVADEARDVIFRSVGIIAEMKPNVPLDLFMKEKIDHTVNKKYPVKEIKKYVSQGLTHEQAMEKRKREFKS
jgi:hypothetical protein